ncbi:hypothetical protein B0H10DRAFT_1960774 [Mycena sp. CBHHK59/15]|nr:hypothetical protein B0H10DRAFT_1960774 [Mycena sp. CBHHK59/15]
MAPFSVDTKSTQVTYSARKRARQVAKIRLRQEREKAREALLLVWAEMEKNTAREDTEYFAAQMVFAPWDFGPVEKPVVLDRTAPAATGESGPVSWTLDRKVSMQEVDDCNSDWSSETEGLRKTKVAVASASSPGECCGISPLRIGVDSESTASAEGLRKNKVAVASLVIRESTVVTLP